MIWSAGDANGIVVTGAEPALAVDPALGTVVMVAASPDVAVTGSTVVLTRPFLSVMVRVVDDTFSDVVVLMGTQPSMVGTIRLMVYGSLETDTEL